MLRPPPQPSTPGPSTCELGCGACGWRPVAGELWPSHGGLAVDWIQRYCICGEGDYFGQPIRLRLDQQKFLWRWYEYCPGCGQWRYNDGLRGAATGDGKTQFIACIAVLEMAGPPQIAVDSPNIRIAAASFEQANLLFSAAAIMCGGRDQSVPDAPLCGLFTVYDTQITFADGRPGSIMRVAAVAGTNEGGIPTLLIGDELHEWGEPGSRKARVWTVIGKSTFKRRTKRGAGRRLALSTAGFDVENSLLGQYYKLGLRVRRDPAVMPRFLFDWREAPDGLDYEDPADRAVAVRAASGAADVLWSVADRVNAWGDPSMARHEWLRYFANTWVDVAEESWLKDYPAAWAACAGRWETDPANPFVVSVDMALKRDSVAVTRVELLADGRVAVTARIWQPSYGSIDHVEVFGYIRTLATGSGFRGVGYDPRFFELPSRQLEDDGVAIIEFSQQADKMAPACGLTYDMILAGRIVHDGDPVLAGHVKAAVKREAERGFTLSKGKSRRHIDGAVAMCMGVWILLAVEKRPDLIPLASFG